MNRTTLNVFAIALAALLGAACSTKHADMPGPICQHSPGVVSRGSNLQIDSVGILDKQLGPEGLVKQGRGGVIAIRGTNTRRTATGSLEVWATMRNCVAEPVVVEARTHFLNAAQAPLESPSGWRRIFLPQAGFGSYSAISKGTSEVAHYYIEMREAR